MNACQGNRNCRDSIPSHVLKTMCQNDRYLSGDVLNDKPIWKLLDYFYLYK